MVATPLKNKILKLDKTKTKQKGKKTKKTEQAYHANLGIVVLAAKMVGSTTSQ